MTLQLCSDATLMYTHINMFGTKVLHNKETASPQFVTVVLWRRDHSKLLNVYRLYRVYIDSAMTQ
eukprot:1388568-Amphidinium_carterae.2